jgi:hypothetical protein
MESVAREYDVISGLVYSTSTSGSGQAMPKELDAFVKELNRPEYSGGVDLLSVLLTFVAIGAVFMTLSSIVSLIASLFSSCLPKGMSPPAVLSFEREEGTAEEGIKKTEVFLGDRVISTTYTLERSGEEVETAEKKRNTLLGRIRNNLLFFLGLVGVLSLLVLYTYIASLPLLKDYLFFVPLFKPIRYLFVLIAKMIFSTTVVPGRFGVAIQIFYLGINFIWVIATAVISLMRYQILFYAVNFSLAIGVLCIFEYISTKKAVPLRAVRDYARMFVGTPVLEILGKLANVFLLTFAVYIGLIYMGAIHVSVAPSVVYYIKFLNREIASRTALQGH